MDKSNNTPKIDWRFGFDRSKNILNQRFGRLVVVKRAGTSKHRMALWECACDCGNKNIVTTGSLIAGQSLSCGCLRKDAVKTHGLSKKQVYRTWRAMMSRCYDPISNRFDSYADRGIRVCEPWHDFETFVTDMGHPPGRNYSIERIDNDGDYEPSNCRWATVKEQARNRRDTFWIEFRGETKSLAEWAEELNINYKLAWKDIRVRGISPDHVFAQALELK